MTNEQKAIFTVRKKEWAEMLRQIEALSLPTRWTEIFTTLCLDRGFRRLQVEQLGQMRQIAEVNSKAVGYLAQQDKRAGLTMMERIALEIADERTRSKAVQLILDKGVKESRRELDLIIAMADNTPSLFDTAEGTA